ncbi:MAG: hypothetical protein IJ687_03490 [Bacteroidales bacterium]|jgi:hypothetical protein|nr:hypothetical protein [Bacteroidales bacterium]MBR1893680.1 hypothetical protein [Bacteroidales bacterium]
MRICRFLIIVAILVLACPGTRAQFKRDAFTQNYSDLKDTTARKDSIDKMFSFKEFFRGVSHKQELLPGTLFAGSMLFIGSQQIYHKDYWKLPIIYGGLGATVGLGIHYRRSFNETGNEHSRNLSTAMFIGAGAIYWATLMDGVIRYPSGGRHPHPGKATLYSLLLPGLGQAYNGEYWKIPIYWGGLVASFHYYNLNNTNYLRYKRIYNEATDPESTTKPPISADAALYYRDVFRRWRDYSIVAILGVYLLQIIDANVFAYMQDFDVSDDLSMHIAPAVITPETTYAMRHTPFAPTGYGLSVGFRF